MTIEEIKALVGVTVEETEKFVKVTPQSGYILLIKSPHQLPIEGEGTAEEEAAGEWTETDSVFLPLNCQDAPELSTEESDITDGTATADENGEAVVTSLEERVLRLEARVSALEADLAAASGDGGAAMMIDDEL